MVAVVDSRGTTGHALVTDPTCPQPGFTLPRRKFVILNRLRCGQARCAESLHRWGVIASPACPCGESHQTTMHLVEECSLTAFPGGLQCLHQAGHDAVEWWLSRLSLKLGECSKRTTTTTGRKNINYQNISTGDSKGASPPGNDREPAMCFWVQLSVTSLCRFHV